MLGDAVVVVISSSTQKLKFDVQPVFALVPILARRAQSRVEALSLAMNAGNE